jgi:Ca2+-binding RTX toxin-like protein
MSDTIIIGTASDDWLTGTSGDDYIEGLEGADQLQGLEGNDTLVGGAGNDVLDGGIGDDTYVFDLGDGVDYINDLATLTETNRVVFGQGITADDLQIRTTDANGYWVQPYIQVGTNGDALHFSAPRIRSKRSAPRTAVRYLTVKSIN